MMSNGVDRYICSPDVQETILDKSFSAILYLVEKYCLDLVSKNRIGIQFLWLIHCVHCFRILKKNVYWQKHYWHHSHIIPNPEAISVLSIWVS